MLRELYVVNKTVYQKNKASYHLTLFCFLFIRLTKLDFRQNVSFSYFLHIAN